MLAPDVATRLGRGLGVDPSPVRVHTDSLSASATAELGVRAFTWGVDVFLAKGERPTDVPLLAHEVTHAIQQSGGPAIHLFDGPHGELEHEAHRNAAVLARGGQATVHGRTSGLRVQGLFDWAKRGVAAVGGAISAAATAVADVGAAVRDRVMTFIKDKAKTIPGYDLLCFVLGRDPITQQPVERTAENLIKAVLGLVPGGDALFANLQQAKVIQRAHDWFTAEIAKLNITWDYIRGLFAQAWDALSVSDLADPGGAWEKLKGIFGPPLSRLRTFAVDAGHKVLEFVFEGALALAGGAGQHVLAIFRRIGSVFSLIVTDPVKFLTNLLNAVKGGFNQFWANIGAHLRTGVFEWLMGAMQGVIQLPPKWDFSGILSLILQILGLTYSALRAILVKILGEKTVTYIEQAFEFVKLIVTKGLAAAWEKIKEFASGLADQVITAIRDWITKSVVGAAVTKLVTMFNPVGAVIQGIITIYNTIMFFIERAQQIARLVNSILDSIENIAKGATKTASDFVEKTLANTLPVIIGFLARLVGLGSVTEYIRDIIGKIRTAIAGALEKLGLWIKDRIQGLLAGRKDATVEPATAPGAAMSDGFVYEKREGEHVIRIRRDLRVVQFSTPTDIIGEKARAEQQEALEHLVPREEMSYPADSLGRADGPSGHVKRVKENEERGPMPGRGPGYLPGDHRGHLIGDKFDGSSVETNFVPMYPRLNTSTFATWERRVATKYTKYFKEAKRAVLLHMRVKPTYPPGGASSAVFRPVSVTGTAKIITLKPGAEKLTINEELESSGSLPNPTPDIEPFNVNEAALERLQTLVRSTDLAELLISERGRRGKFRDYDDLQLRMVSVLGDKTYLLVVLEPLKSKMTF